MLRDVGIQHCMPRPCLTPLQSAAFFEDVCGEHRCYGIILEQKLISAYAINVLFARRLCSRQHTLRKAVGEPQP